MNSLTNPMVPDQTRKTLSQQDSDAMWANRATGMYRMVLTSNSTALNQRNSPLLRLPGEIRNCIYAYVLGGLIINSPKPLRLYIRLLRQTSSFESRICTSAYKDGSTNPSQAMSSHLDLLYTCRSIFIETSLLPFALNKFEIHSMKLSHFLGGLTTTQKDAITTLKIDHSLLMIEYHRDLSRWVINHHFGRVRDGADDLFVYWSGLQELAHMKGLKCVEVGNTYFAELGVTAPVKRETVVAKIRESVGGRNIQVAVDDPPMWLGPDRKPTNAPPF